METECMGRLVQPGGADAEPAADEVLDKVVEKSEGFGARGPEGVFVVGGGSKGGLRAVVDRGVEEVARAFLGGLMREGLAITTILMIAFAISVAFGWLVFAATKKCPLCPCPPPVKVEELWRV